jgi:hypothetical protein
MATFKFRIRDFREGFIVPRYYNLFLAGTRGPRFIKGYLSLNSSTGIFNTRSNDT